MNSGGAALRQPAQGRDKGLTVAGGSDDLATEGVAALQTAWMVVMPGFLYPTRSVR
jgi:hypothetical protein